MKNRQLIQGIFASVGILILIIDGKTASAGVSEGIKLCLQTVIPSLFPFFLLSILLTNAFEGKRSPLLRPICCLFRIPEGAESIFLSGILGGYPVGAQCITEAYHSGYLSKNNSLHMLRFCSNAGPSFLFGMISNFFDDKKVIWLLWIIHITCAFFVARVFPFQPEEIESLKKNNAISVSHALWKSIRIMATVCGWIVIFRVLLHFLKKWIFWYLSDEIAVLVTGFLELSNGCCELSRISDEKIRFIICSCMLAFGGLCVTMQTASVIQDLPLSVYLQGKIMQTFFSFALCCGIIYNIWYLILITVSIIIIMLRNQQKKSRISAAIVV